MPKPTERQSRRGPLAKEIERHQRALLDRIAHYEPLGGPPRHLRESLRDAFMACPRHRFLHRFRLTRNGPVHELTRRTLRNLLPAIYSEDLQIYVDADGTSLKASNSEPGHVMYLLELLDLRPGHKVLEIGSGGGWLAGVIGHAVGPKGHVTGIEIDEQLAEQSRQDLAALGIDNVEIVTGDGAEGCVARAPFDRATITAACSTLPAMLFDQLVDGGLVVVPLSNKGGGEETFLLRREGGVFRSLTSTSAWYVPLVGASRVEGFEGRPLEDLPLWQALKDRPCYERPLWLGGRGARDFPMRTHRFRTFLSKVDSRYELFTYAPQPEARPGPRICFGLADAAAESLAIFWPDKLVGYGSPCAAEACMTAFDRWCGLGMPSGLFFDLKIHRAGTAPPPDSQHLVERRGEVELVWSLPEVLQ